MNGTPLRARPGIVARVTGPRIAPFQKSALGVGGYHATIKLTNTAALAVDVDDMGMTFSAARDGVPFPCREHPGGQPRVREPHQLLPGESFTYERDIDCATTLLGRYEVTANVGFRGAAPEFAGSFPLDLVGGGASVPKPYPGRPALHVALAGESIVRGVPSAVSYAPVVVLTNDSPQPILLGAVRVVLTLSTAAGARIGCQSENGKSNHVDVWKNAPYTLAPGASQVVSVPMRCAAPGDGDYRVDGFVVLGDGPIEEGAPVGPVPLKITQDPALTVPPVETPTTNEEERRRQIQ
jgi:hypothetical protein